MESYYNEVTLGPDLYELEATPMLLPTWTSGIQGKAVIRVDSCYISHTLQMSPNENERTSKDNRVCTRDASCMQKSTARFS